MVEHPSRRALLLVAAVAGLAACSGDALTPLPQLPGAEELAIRQVVADATLLRASAQSMAARFAPGTASRSLYQGLAADHLAHLVALGADPASGVASASETAAPSPAVTTSTSASASASASASPGASAAPDSPAEQLDAEWDAARSALRLGLAAQAGGLAQLLVRIAAARAAHADLIAAATRADTPGELRPPSDSGAGATPTPAASTSAPVPGSPSDTLPGPSTPSGTSESDSQSGSSTPSPGSVLASPTDRALNRLLAGEHAAVYAYPVVIARTTGSRRDFARQLWAAHRYERDTLIVRLTSAGIQPAEAQAAYAISPIPGSPRQAVQLAAQLERGLAALAADVVATALPGTDRITGADALVLAGRRTATWAGHADPLPGGSETKVSASPGAGSAASATDDVDATADPTSDVSSGSGVSSDLSPAASTGPTVSPPTTAPTSAS